MRLQKKARTTAPPYTQLSKPDARCKTAAGTPSHPRDVQSTRNRPQANFIGALLLAAAYGFLVHKGRRDFGRDRAALARSYHVRYAHHDQNKTGWRLDLTPKQAPLDKLLKQLSLHGDADAVTQIVLIEPSGDRTVTMITELNPRRRFSQKFQQGVFGVQPAKPKTTAK